MTPSVILGMPAAQYHADPCPEPSLSASVAHLLDTQSALHAWTAHPKLNPEWTLDDPTAAQEVGTALHALIIEGRDIITPCPFPNWTTKDARVARDAARLGGNIPLLAHNAAEARRCAATVRDRLAQHEAKDAFTDGEPEAVLVWQERTPYGPVWCRSRCDWLGTRWLDDLKTTGGSAHPDTWCRKVAKEGYALQAAFYLRGARALGRQPRGFRFVVIEQEPPYGLSVVTLAGDMLAIADAAVERALEAWGWCLREQQWPGYPTQIHRLSATGWELAQLEERQQAPRRGYMHSEPAVVQSGAPWA